ncbi:MAG TPA: 50S ribosomal protein L32 [Dehalococcoidales bacterium]|nr:MAG: 50S ribosomal protein L32 [Chloroflexi bacterium RBG_16_60_22]HJX12895.1 50S ribosomal protein L32 [Dehalococcoidales bacterium]
MGALPKRKVSPARAGRRLSHIARKPPALVECPQCHSLKMPHHTCPTCGTYNGRQVIKMEGRKKEGG